MIPICFRSMKFKILKFFYAIFITKNFLICLRTMKIFECEIVGYFSICFRTMKIFLVQISSINPRWYRY